MQNTFWTLIENSYYRIENNQLKYAPVNPKDNSVIIENIQPAKDISASTLKLINDTFNTTITL